MGVHCYIIGCSNESGRCKASFFRLPAVIQNQCEKTKQLSAKRRQTWLSRISRADLTSKSYPYVRVCSEHFVFGKPSPLFKDDDIDWAPSLKLGHQKNVPIPTPDRGARIRQRQEKKMTIDAAHSLLQLFQSESEDLSADLENDFHHATRDDQVEESGVGCQTELNVTQIDNLQEDYNRLVKENIQLKEKLDDSIISEASLHGNHHRVKMLTGVLNFDVLMTLFNYLQPSLFVTHSSSLTKFQQMMLVLIRLKLGFSVSYLSELFRISPSTVSKVFLNVLNVMYIKLKPCIYWPDREELRETMPMDFRKHFGLRVAVIIDCFEIFIERPSSLTARAQTWSSYKHHNTAKYLIGITPQGSVSFISHGYGGRASDKLITNDCGFLDKLIYGDLVLADRGFDVGESIAQAGCELKIPAFTRGKTQLSAVDVEQTRKIAHVRIHVERVIGLVRGKFDMLQKTAPIDYLMSDQGSQNILKHGCPSGICPLKLGCPNLKLLALIQCRFSTHNETINSHVHASDVYLIYFIMNQGKLRFILCQDLFLFQPSQ